MFIHTVKLWKQMPRPQEGPNVPTVDNVTVML